MRDRIVDELGDLAHRRFLVYLMGPYRAFDVEHVLQTEALETVPESMDLETLADPETDRREGQTRHRRGHEPVRSEATLDLLLELRDGLRTGPGVNAFLAIDVDVPLDELDAASQSIAFARAANAVVYVVPAIGDNLGVGIEVGAVLEALFGGDDGEASDDEDGGEASDDGEDGPGGHHRERVLFVHESGVHSAMIAAVRERWEARVYRYESRADLDRQLRLFVRDLIRKERLGKLPRLG